MSGMLPYLLQRTFASRALDVVKMRAFVPCEVDNPLTRYRGTMVEVVFDPLHIAEVNDRFEAEGYQLPDESAVIAVMRGGSILVWGGLNSVFRLRKGEAVSGIFDDKHLAFYDILDLTGRFKIKNKKVEIDALIEQLRALCPDG